jgi:2-dehydropantoate 2-reductase
MKVSVLGAGAVGCMISGLMKMNDPSIDLWLYARGEHADRMRRDGTMQLQGSWGTTNIDVNVCQSIADIADSDLILLTAKSTATEEIMQAAKPFIGRSILVSLQNGINQHTIGRFLDPTQYFVGITATNMSIPTPGVIALHLAGPTIIGPPQGSSTGDGKSFNAPLLQILAKSGLPMLGHQPIWEVQFNKISVNSLGYTSALSQSNFATECLLDPTWRRTIAVPMLAESERVMLASGISIAHVPGPSDVLRLRKALKLLENPLARYPISWLIRRRGTPRLIYSVEQDLLRGRPTEIDFVNGEIVRLANEHSVDVPLHRLSVDLAHELEQRSSDRFLSRDDVIRRFAAVGKS